MKGLAWAIVANFVLVLVAILTDATPPFAYFLGGIGAICGWVAYGYDARRGAP